MKWLDLKSIRYAALGALGVFAIHGAMAPAQIVSDHNSNAPIDFAADRIELQDRTDRVTLSGGVVVSQAGLTLRSSRMTIAYTDAGGVDVNRIAATGGVRITKQDLSAVGDTAIYDIDSRLITLVGNVSLRQGSNRLNGGRVTIDLASGRSAIDGSTAAGGSGDNGLSVQQQRSGRVTGTFTVPQRN